MASIPHDILLEILDRLPAKSIITFKSVCKEWKHHLESWDFIQRHYNRCFRSDLDATNSSLIVTRESSLYILADPSIPCRLIKLSVPRQFQHNNIIIEAIESSNGFVCVAYGQCFTGFGFDSHNTDFKIFYYGYYYQYPWTAFVSIFSLNSGSWKPLLSFSSRFHLERKEAPTWQAYLNTLKMLNALKRLKSLETIVAELKMENAELKMENAELKMENAELKKAILMAGNNNAATDPGSSALDPTRSMLPNMTDGGPVPSQTHSSAPSPSPL